MKILLLSLGLFFSVSLFAKEGSVHIQLDGEHVKIDVKNIDLSPAGLEAFEAFVERKARKLEKWGGEVEMTFQGRSLERLSATLNTLKPGDPKNDEALEDLWKRLSTHKSHGKGKDRVIIGRKFHIARNDNVGELVAIGATGTIEGHVENLVAIGSRISVAPTARVDDEFIALGSDLRVEEGASVDATQVNVFFPFGEGFSDVMETVSTLPEFPWGLGLWWRFSTLFLLFVFGFAYLRIAPDLYQETVRTLDRERGPSIGIGFIAFMLFVPGAMILALTLVGIPLIPLYAILAIFIYLLGYINSAHCAAQWAAPGKLTDWKALAVGLLAFKLLLFIPILGALASFVAGLWGMGALLHTLWARRKAGSPRSLSEH